jgi:hypothetical protein
MAVDQAACEVMHPIHRLHEVVDAFHHERAERQRQPPEGTRRRKHAGKLEELEAAFERLVEHWIPDERARRRWREYLSHGGAHPDTPIARDPILFEGRSDDGGLAEIRRKGEGVEILVDGRQVGDAARWSGSMVSMGDTIYRETTRASDQAIASLRAYVAAQGPPPWSRALELYEDGLVDENFSLTDRGRRVLDLHD